jgi:hypothetical protein
MLLTLKLIIMKTKFKDYLLYTLSTIGVVALFISATTLPPQTSTVPESHVWEMTTAVRSGGIDRVYALNKATGEVRKYTSSNMRDDKNNPHYYVVMNKK